MLHVSNLSKYYADRVVLRGVSFTVPAGKHVGLVGPNGGGKSTLLRLITGLERPDEGSVAIAPGVRVGYLRQGFLGDETRPVATVLEPDGAVWAASVALQRATEGLAKEYERHEDTTDAYDAYDAYERASTRFEDLGGYARLSEVEKVLRGLGLDGLDPARAVVTLSGGQRTRLALAPLLLGAPGLLVLDEPTNHLDADALAFLEDYIARYHGAVLMASHDRAFLDATVDTILALDAETHSVTSYSGGYSDLVAAREAALEAQWQSYRARQREQARVEEDIRNVRAHAMHTERATKDSSARRLANKVMRTAIVRERKLEKSLDANHVDKPTAGWTLKLDFSAPSGGAREALRAEGLVKRYGQHTVLDKVDLALRHGERVVVTGPNGGGKSTLLRIIAGELTPDAGYVRLGAGVVPGYYSQDQEDLDPTQTPLDVIRNVATMTETEARTFLHGYLFGGDAVFTLVSSLSYGERARLALAQLVLSGTNLILLDEPTNHLDIPSRESFEAALSTFSGTVLAVLHDRYAIARLATRVLELRDGQLL